MTLVCGACGTVVEPAWSTWRCQCGGPLSFTALHVEPPAALERVSMGEGNTSLETVTIGGRNVFAKLEFEAPTGSFKDRGAAVLIAAALDIGATSVVADSSGNAGVAIAAYAARAELPCEVYVSAGLASSKLARINADVVTVKGTREDVAAAAVARVAETGAFYASHVWNPWFFEGTKQYVHEIVAQLGRLPPSLIAATGQRHVMLGAWRTERDRRL